MAATRTLSLPSFDNFDPSSHPGSELKAFNMWLRRFDNRYKLVTTVADDATAAQKEADKKAWLLNYVVDGVLDNFEALYADTPTWEASTYTDLIAKYKEQLKPNQTSTLVRHRFYKLHQKEGEMFDTFVSTVKREVVYCEFSCAADITTITRDQIIKGVLQERIREAALKNDWTLDNLIKNGRKMEAAKASITELRQESDSQQVKAELTPKTESLYKVDTSRGRYTAKPPSNYPCTYCGSHCSGGNKCPALGHTCTYCHKPNHFETACIRKKKRIPRPQPNPKNIRQVAVGEDSDSADEVRSEQGKPFLKPGRSLPIFAVTGQNEDGTPSTTVDVSVDSNKMPVVPDSGAGGSVMPNSCIPGNLTLKSTRTVLLPYKSDPIYPLGKVWLTTT